MKRWLLAALMFVGSLAQAQYVTLTGTIQGSNGVVADDYTISFTPTQMFFVAGSSVVVPTSSSCATSVDGTVVGLPNPSTNPVLSAGFTGTLPPGNYYVDFTFYAATSETLPSSEAVVQLTSTGQIQLASPAQGIPSSALGMRVYVGTASGAETLQGQTTGNNSYTQSAPLATGVAPPTSNNTVCKQIANDAGWPTGTGYKVALADSYGNVVPGYPMVWQLLGPNTTINLTSGLPYYNGIVLYPSPILASPYNHNLQSISGPLNLQGYAISNVSYLTACVVNGVENVESYCWAAIPDLGDKITAALANCASQCTLYIPPGNYSYAHSITLPLNIDGTYKLTGDPGAVAAYTGSGDAIVTPIGVNGPGESQLVIEGFELIGNGAATSGIHTYPTNRVTIRNMNIQGFSAGDGIRVEGTNSSNIYDNFISNNAIGIHLIPTLCNSSYPYSCSPTGSGNGYTPNALHIHDNQITSNTHWGGFDDRANATAGLSGSLNNIWAWNDMEQNGSAGPQYGALYLMHGRGSTIQGNYFEGSPRNIVLGELGAGGALNTSGTTLLSNYFTTAPPSGLATSAYNIELQNVTDTLIEGNTELVGPGTGGNNCFLEASTGGETRTLLGRNAIFQVSPSGNPICVNGVASNALVGAGSSTLISQNYQSYMADQFFVINTTVTSESVGIANMTPAGDCRAVSSTGNTTPINAGTASIYAGTTKVTAAAAGGITLVHPSGTAETIDLVCENNPSGGYGYP